MKGDPGHFLPQPPPGTELDPLEPSPGSGLKVGGTSSCGPQAASQNGLINVPSDVLGYSWQRGRSPSSWLPSCRATGAAGRWGLHGSSFPEGAEFQWLQHLPLTAPVIGSTMLLPLLLLTVNRAPPSQHPAAPREWKVGHGGLGSPSLGREERGGRKPGPRGKSQVGLPVTWGK